MRLPLIFSGILLALSLVVTGCGGGDKKDPTPDNNASSGNSTARAVQTTGTTSHPSQEAVMKFLEEMLGNNVQNAFALLTPKAQQEYAKANAGLNPAYFTDMKFRITGGDAMPETDDSVFAVYVDATTEEDDEVIETVWCVRKIGNEYRIASLMMNYDGQFLPLDFEDPQGTRQTGAELLQASDMTVPPQNQMTQNQTAGQQFADMPIPQSTPADMQTPQFNAPQFDPSTFQTPAMQQPPQMAAPTTPMLQ